jgi:hypothetical protein
MFHKRIQKIFMMFVTELSIRKIIGRIEVICSTNLNGCWSLNKAGKQQNKQKIFGHF